MKLLSRSILMLAAIVFALAMSMTPTLAQGYLYTAGDKIRQWDLQNLTNPTLVWNFPGSDVAVDRVNSKIFWGDNSSGSGKIFRANLNGIGGSALLTTTWVDQMQIDVAAQKIYWIDNSNHIYRYNITTSTVQVLPLNPSDLRAIALDLRPSKLNLYYIDSDSVYRADLKMD